MVEVTPAYETHFIDMYVDKHTGKHLTGDRVRILLLTLPFLPQDLIAPEVCKICTLKSNIFDYSKWYHILYIQWYIKCYIWWYYRKWYHLLYRKWYSSWQFCYRSTCKTFYGHTGWGVTLRRGTWDVNMYLTLWEEHMISYITHTIASLNAQYRQVNCLVEMAPSAPSRRPPRHRVEFDGFPSRDEFDGFPGPII